MDAPMSVTMSILQLWMLQCHWHWGIHSYRVDLVFLLFGVMPTSHRILTINQLTLIICYSKSHIKQIAIAETKQNLRTKISTMVERNCLLTHWIIHQSSLIWEHNCTKNINIYSLPWITVFFDHVKVQFIINMYFLHILNYCWQCLFTKSQNEFGSVIMEQMGCLSWGFSRQKL